MDMKVVAGARQLGPSSGVLYCLVTDFINEILCTENSTKNNLVDII